MRPGNILITHDFQPMVRVKLVCIMRILQKSISHIAIYDLPLHLDQLSYYGFINQYEALGQSSGQLPKQSALKTFEHLAPEYHETGKELSKADVFSFGVVLLELITGRKTVEDTDGQSFLRWVIFVFVTENKQLDKQYGGLRNSNLVFHLISGKTTLKAKEIHRID